ncbi:unnamed protein product, partial [Mesorhabditis belari]|uniref:Apple domain-containing protein n=1 Tax=Mesorhabditis belari TaxID=2138241 RepID=A0AAF3FGN6_9BILA
MRLLILLALCANFLRAEENWRVLRPCFERYLQTKLANLEPFHSEGRMPTEDHCLRFCAETASRCRSIVYEPLRHVCHFFLDEGSEMAVPAQHMSYFRVTTQECLDHVAVVLGPMDIEGAPVEYSPLDDADLMNGKSTVTESAVTRKSTVEKTSGATRMEKIEETIETTTDNREPVDQEPEYEEETEEITEPAPTTTTERNEEMTTLRDEVNDGNEMSKEFSKMSEMIDVVSRESDEKSMDTAEVEQELRKKMHQLRELFPERFDQLVGKKRGDDEEDEEILEEELHPAEMPTTTTTKPTTTTKIKAIVLDSEDVVDESEVGNLDEEALWQGANPQHLPTHRRSRFFNQAKVLQISKDRLEPGFGKIKKRKFKVTEGELPGEIINYEGLRRSPSRKMERAQSSETKPFVDKAQSFLDEIAADQQGFELQRESDDEENEDIERIAKPKQSFDVAESDGGDKIVAAFEKTVVKKSRACPSNEAPLWMIWEGGEQQNDDESMGEIIRFPTRRHCENSCNQLDDCLGYTYHEKSGECAANEGFDGVTVKASHSSDASTSTKFCFTDALPVFNQCPPMRGFIGFSLEVKPREEFTSLPKGYHGLRMCIELCVLSTEYSCRSASFISDEGRCLLNGENSETTPEAFQRTFIQEHLYFENECSRVTHITQNEAEHQTVVRVSKGHPESSEKKTMIKQKTESPIKPMKKLRLVKIKPKRLSPEPAIDARQSMDLIKYTGAFFRRFFRF